MLVLEANVIFIDNLEQPGAPDDTLPAPGDIHAEQANRFGDRRQPLGMVDEAIHESFGSSRRRKLV
jgi:hypothetical protein